MACKRDRTGELINFIHKLGIDLNIGKNRARGNKGFFKAINSNYRIDISKQLPEDERLRILIHELVHYVHFNYDKTLKSVDFIFDQKYNEYEEDLLKLAVDTVPKDFAKDILNKRETLKKEIKSISDSIKKSYPNIKLSDKNNQLKKEISKFEFKHLLKYDRVKLLSGFSTKIYSLQNLRNEFPNIKPEYEQYLMLCSLKRKLNSINNKISRLNRYYSSPSELLARSFEYYIMEPEYMENKTPKLYNRYKEIIKSKRIKMLSDMVEIVSS